VLVYYLATPLFALLDFGFGVNMRAVFVESDLLRALYYLVPLACGLVGWKRPELATRLGMAESGFSLACIIIGVWLAVFGVSEAMDEGRALSPIFTTAGMINVALSGGVLALSFYGNQAALKRE
jgi:hypothetical protein